MTINGEAPRPGTMRMRPTEYPHILWNIDKDLPCISGTRLRVQDVAALHLGGRSLDEIEEAYPTYSRAELLSALAYYYDHQREMDARRRERLPWRVLYTTPQWRRISKDQLTREPLCCMCLADGRVMRL